MKKTKKDSTDIISNKYKNQADGPIDSIVQFCKGGVDMGDGSRGGRIKYFKFQFKYQFLRWIKAPWRCKIGTHRIGPHSDTGMGISQKGMMDIWCGDCDARLEVPIDDVKQMKNCKSTLNLAEKYLNKDIE